uniref:Uncharacterized protein n=1 Tax=Psilocybe cubensis TaxID=181762 RepID=A0A8H7XSD7_PSICU
MLEDGQGSRSWLREGIPDLRRAHRFQLGQEQFHITSPQPNNSPIDDPNHSHQFLRVALLNLSSTQNICLEAERVQHSATRIIDAHAPSPIEISRTPAVSSASSIGDPDPRTFLPCRVSTNSSDTLHHFLMDLVITRHVLQPVERGLQGR